MGERTEDKTELPQDYVGRNARKNQKVSIKLHEVRALVSRRGEATGGVCMCMPGMPCRACAAVNGVLAA